MSPAFPLSTPRTQLQDDPVGMVRPARGRAGKAPRYHGPSKHSRPRKPTPEWPSPLGTRGRSTRIADPRPGPGARAGREGGDRGDHPGSAGARAIDATYRNLSTAELYEHAIRNGEGVDLGPRLAGRPHRQAHRSLAARQVRRSRAGATATRSGGDRSTSHSPRSTTTACERGCSHYVADRPLYSQDLYIGAHPDHRRSLRVYTETAWASIFARNLFRRPPLERPRALRAELHDHRRPVLHRRSGHGGGAQRDRHPAPPRADGDHHRGHRVRRRDQEVGLHGHELPAARRGDAADAFIGQCRQGRRPGALLRALRHRQDDALRRSRAEPHRRRRAWLGSRWALQLRGRLLRQDHPPLADVRAGHLRDHAPLRHDPGERRRSTR